MKKRALVPYAQGPASARNEGNVDLVQVAAKAKDILTNVGSLLEVVVGLIPGERQK